jgi:hypothetical protein
MTDIFIAYSHEDLGFKNELKKFLRPMLREERISVWDDFDIEAGQDWDAKIKERLYGADIILLLVSSDSLASDYFYGKEVKVSLERHAKGEAVVVPIILRHCDWENTPLGGLEALPEKGRPVVEWPTRDQAWQDTVSRLRRVIENIEKQRKTANEHGEALRAFKAAVEAADHLFSNQRWQEARAAYSHALAAHLPGFLPDRSQVTQKIADCDQNLRAEADLARQAAEAEKRRQREEARMAKQAREGGSNKNRNLLLTTLGGAALLIAIWLALRPGSQDSPAEKQPDTTETPEQLEGAAYQKALTANTIPALEDYLSQYPAGKNAAAARQKLADLQSQFKNLLSDANLFMDDDPATACGYLQKALALSPGHTDVLKKLDKLKCN